MTEREELKEEITQLLEELISFKTVASQPDELKAIIDHTEDQLSDLPVHISRYEREGKHSLVATNRDTKEPEVMLVAHLDVVDASDDMFKPLREENILRGRGAIDMKGPAAVLITLFKRWAARDVSLGLMLTTDEEVGSEHGINYLLSEEGWSAKVAVVPDGGLNFSVVTRNKGAYHFQVNAKGKPAHGSTPWLGENAVDKILSFYLDLREFVHPKPNFDPERWYNTLNLGLIRGGRKVNMVPSEAIAQFDLRFVRPLKLEDVRAMVSALANKWGLEVEELTAAEVVEVPLEHPYVNTFLRVYEEVMGCEPTLEGEHGATDARFFAERGIPVITIYPVGGDIHGDNEWVDLDSLVTLYELFDRYLQRIEAGELEELPDEVNGSAWE